LASDQDWDTTSTSYASQNYSITDSRVGNYSYYANSQLLLAHPIDLTNTTNPILTFWQKFYTEGTHDYCTVEISDDNGFNWQEITRYSGGNRTWSHIQIDLSDYKTSIILVRFRLRANGPNNQYDGWYLDDVEIKELDTELTPFPFKDEFENGLNNWLVSDQDWDTTSTSYASQNYSITDSPNKDYTYNANSHFLLAHPIDLTNTTHPILTFWQKFYTESNNDNCILEISEDSGFNWQEIARYSGGNRTWSHIQIDLSDYRTSIILVRFRLRANGPNTQYDGWYVDDFEIKELDTKLTQFPFSLITLKVDLLIG
jgi:hypothetical protein